MYCGGDANKQTQQVMYNSFDDVKNRPRFVTVKCQNAKLASLIDTCREVQAEFLEAAASRLVSLGGSFGP